MLNTIKNLFTCFHGNQLDGQANLNNTNTRTVTNPSSNAAQHVASSSQGIAILHRPNMMQQNLITNERNRLTSLAQRQNIKLTKKLSSIRSHDVDEVNRFFLSDYNSFSLIDRNKQNFLKIFFQQIDCFYKNMEHLYNADFNDINFESKKVIFEKALNDNQDHGFDFVKEYLEIPYFRGRNKILIDVSRKKLTDDIANHFQMSSSQLNPSVKRIIKEDIDKVSQGDYVMHVCNLFNLENFIDINDIDKISRSLNQDDLKSLQNIVNSGQPIIGAKYKDAILYLLNYFPLAENTADRTSRNTHPASVFLQHATGFVFHPGYKNTAITSAKSPFSFENISMSLVLKYSEAKQLDKLPAFFETAFVAQEPCYEATVENIMNFDPNPNSSEIIFHQKPLWNDDLTDVDNLDGLLAWVQRESIKDYALTNRISLAQLSLTDVLKVEGSKRFANFLHSNIDMIVNRMQIEVGSRVSYSEMYSHVHADLTLGLTAAT